MGKEVRKTIANRLKNARIAAGFNSIEDFCQKNNLNLSKYQKHENAVTPLKASYALRYGKLLGVSLQELIIGDLFRNKPKSN